MLGFMVVQVKVLPKEYNFVNETVRSGKFPLILKYANIALVFEKDFRGSKENDHSVNILPVISKTFEKIIGKQLTTLMDQIIIKIPVWI